MEKFKSKILLLPGLGNSGDGHWQSIWEEKFGFERIYQSDWDTPICSDWIVAIQHAVERCSPAEVILVGHSLACNAIVQWSARCPMKIKAALLVAPSDTEATSYPKGTTGFVPMPTNKLQFPSLTIASSNDPYVTLQRASYFANAWASKLINIGDAGHINVASGHGKWEEGLKFLRELDVL